MTLRNTPQEILDAIQRGDEARKDSLELLQKKAEAKRITDKEEEDRLLQEIEDIARTWIPSALERVRAEGRSTLVMDFGWVVPGTNHPFSRYPYYLVYQKLKDMYDSRRILVKTKSWVTTDPDWPNEDEHAVIVEVY